MRLAEISEKEFAKFVEKKVCNNFLQSVEMYRRYKKNGSEAYLLGLFDNDSLVAAALVRKARELRGQGVWRVAGGPILDYDTEGAGEILREFSRLLAEFLKTKGGMAVSISPNVVAQPRDKKNNVVEGLDHLKLYDVLKKAGWKYLGEYEQVKWVYVLETVGKDPEKMFMEFRSDHRQRIRRAGREKVSIRELGMDELNVLKELAGEAGDRHGFQDPDLNYYREMKEAFGDKVKFMMAEAPVEGKTVPVVAAMFVLYGDEIVYLFSGSARKYQKLGGSHLLQWEMIQEAVETRCRRYNFYGMKPVEGNGVYEFKQGFGGHVEEELGTFMMPLSLLGKIYTCKIKKQEYGEVH